MKKIIEMIFVGTIMLTVAGCQNHKKSTITKQTGVGKVQKTNSSNDDNDRGNRTFGSNSNTSGSTWNSEKQDKLDDFLDDWATTMNQEYEKYDGDGQITTAAGEKFPRDFNRVYVNGQKVSLSYEPSGKGNADYNVVAIYNYDKDEGASHITYFFAFHKNRPIVLVDETTNGDKVVAKETENRDLINGFNSIAAGQNASKSNANVSNSKDNNSKEDPKLIGVFIGLLKDGDWFKGNLKDGHMYFSDDSGYGKTKGYDCITTGGDPQSYYWFKQNGNDITVKYNDPNHSPAEGIYKTEHYTVDRLESDYYVNSSQKDEVNGYVDALKSLDDKDD